MLEGTWEGENGRWQAVIGEGSGTLVPKLECPDDSEKTVTFQKIQEQEG